MTDERPWQLAMFSKGLKKNQRLRSLKKHLQDIGVDDQCLLVTCGDNNGAMNYRLRELGGSWSWADLESDCIPEMTMLLGDPVHKASVDRLPFDDNTFDRVISIDVHEHVEDPIQMTGELFRVAKGGAQIIITVPNGDESKLAVRIKNAVNMTPEAYGHTRIGFTVREIKNFMAKSGFEPLEVETYSRFFTEILELSINFAYVKILKKGDDSGADHAEIAPTTEVGLQSVSGSYRIYSMLYPIYWLMSKLDWILVGQEGYCVLVTGRKISR